MSTSLNIKNEQAVTAVRRLASHYGTSCTQAVLRAAEEILAVRDEAALRRDAERLEATLDAYRAQAGRLDGATVGMYDEIGLPTW